jgi:hypothetical protein
MAGIMIVVVILVFLSGCSSSYQEDSSPPVMPPPTTSVSSVPEPQVTTPPRTTQAPSSGASGLKYRIGDIIQGQPGTIKYVVLGGNPAKETYWLAMVFLEDGAYYTYKQEWNDPFVIDADYIEKYYPNRIDHIDPDKLIIK